jgi:hypothetical protein
VTGRPPPAPASRGSSLRLLIGAILIAIALTTAVLGFVRLVTVLEGGGYGTSAMRYALVVLGFAGACLAAGIATVIWEIAKKYEKR